MKPIKGIAKTRVLIVDDHEMFCESLALLLTMRGEVEVLGVANSGSEAIRKAESLRPNIILIDIEMKGLDGLETLKVIKGKFPEIEFIILTMHSDEEYVLEAIKASAKGYVLKEHSSSQVLHAIQYVKEGKVFFDQNCSNTAIQKLSRDFENSKKEKDSTELSQREIQILRLLSEGFTNKEISDKLFISPYTTRNHLTNIFQKLQCHSRAKAVIEAQKRQLIG